MKKVFSTWLLDIAKYIVTALVLSTALTDMVSGWYYYVACFVLLAAIIIFGVLLFKGAEKDEENKKEKSKNS